MAGQPYNHPSSSSPSHAGSNSTLPGSGSNSGVPAIHGARRYVFLTALVVLAVIGGLAGYTFLMPNDTTPRIGSLDELVQGKSPEVAALIREGADVANRVVERFPHDPNALDVMAGFYFRFGMWDEAAACWEQCLDWDPQFAEAYASIGMIAREKGEHQRAADCFAKALELQAESPRFTLELGQCLMDLGKVDEAAALLEKHVQKQPVSVPILVMLGDAHFQLGEHAKAKACLERAVAASPDLASAYYALGRACSALGEEDKAAEYAERFKTLKARDEEAHRSELNQSDYEARVRYDVADTYTAASRACLSRGDPQIAERYLLRAAEIDPQHVGCVETLVWLYSRQERTEDALKALLLADASNPRNMSITMMLGRLYVGMGRFEEAEKAFTSAIDISPGSADGYRAVAGLYLDTNKKLPEARTAALKAVELEPVAENYHLLAVACLRNGERAEARAAIERAIAAAPNHPIYRQFYASLSQSQSE